MLWRMSATKSGARRPQPHFGWRVVYWPVAISWRDWSSWSLADRAAVFLIINQQLQRIEHAMLEILAL